MNPCIQPDIRLDRLEFEKGLGHGVGRSLGLGLYRDIGLYGEYIGVMLG